MKHRLLSELIEDKISLGKESATGFRTVRCAVCNDHSERAGFKFDGEFVGYSCFNCQAKFKYEEGSGKLNRWARQALEAFGITKQELDEVAGSAFFNKIEAPKAMDLASLKEQVKLYTPEVPLPPKSYPLGAAHHDEFQAPIIEYLLSRCVDPLKLNAHFSLDKKYLNRVILPCMRDGKVIYWQARALTNEKPRYLSPGIDKAAVMWGYDNLWIDQDLPLFVTEGIFDAASVNGVALIGSVLNPSKLEVLKRCRRRKVVVVDRDRNGGLLADVALSTGWEITFPPTGSGDINSSIQENGKLFTIWTLMKNMTVPTGLKTAAGVSLQSKLKLDMELALARKR